MIVTAFLSIIRAMIDIRDPTHTVSAHSTRAQSRTGYQ